MVIDVKKLKRSGRYESEFSFDYNVNPELITLPGAVLNGPMNVSGTLALHGEDVYVDGCLRCKIVGECARCLKSVNYDWVAEFSAVYAVIRQDEDDYLYKNGIVDLTPAVDDVILTNIPTVIYCKEDCKGLCPICGKDLNQSPCDCKK